MDEIFTAPASVVVPRTINTIAASAVANPYTAAAVGIAVSAFAAVKLIEKAAPDVEAATDVAKKKVSGFSRRLRRAVHAWTAEDIHYEIVRPAARAAGAAE